MVFFTCNHCGESVKKPAVEKHYNFKCRGAPKNVSCMDCQKDFHGEEYVAHTRCITEAEKYSGKDYVAKESKNSGQKKQDNWMEIIRSILDTKEYNLSNQARSTFQKLQTVDNVPRKKAKFQNFVANCMRMRRDQAEEVWGILEKELEKMKAANATTSQPNGAAPQEPEIPTMQEETPPKETENEAEPKVEIKIEVEEPQEQQEKKKKLKKRKVDKEIQNTIELDEENDILQMAIEQAAGIEPRKKKFKKNKDSATQPEEVSADQEPTVSTTTPDDDFQWPLVMQCTVRKYGEGMKVDKLKKKVQRLYLNKREVATLTDRQQAKFNRKFEKYLNKLSLKLQVVDNIVRLNEEKAKNK